MDSGTIRRGIDPEKLALWSIPAGAVLITVAFLAGGWMATPREPKSMKPARPPVARAPLQAPAELPQYAVAPPPPSVIRRGPDNDVAITPQAPRRIGRTAPAFGSPAFAGNGSSAQSAWAYSGQPGYQAAAPALPGPNPGGFGTPPSAAGFVLPPRGGAGSTPPPEPADDETVRLARARESQIREDQARIEQERAQRMAALDAARRSAAEARARQVRRSYSRSTSSTGDAWRHESNRRNDAFFSESDFHDERRGSSGW